MHEGNGSDERGNAATKTAPQHSIYASNITCDIVVACAVVGW